MRVQSITLGLSSDILGPYKSTCSLCETIIIIVNRLPLTYNEETFHMESFVRIWTASTFLDGRTIVVVIGSGHSPSASLPSGIPSRLGPWASSLYILVAVNLIKMFIAAGARCHQYTDDVELFQLAIHLMHVLSEPSFRNQVFSNRVPLNWPKRNIYPICTLHPLRSSPRLVSIPCTSQLTEVTRFTSGTTLWRHPVFSLLASSGETDSIQNPPT